MVPALVPALALARVPALPPPPPPAAADSAAAEAAQAQLQAP